MTMPGRGDSLRELTRIGPSGLIPPLEMTAAHPASVRASRASVHQAQAAAEYRVSRIEDQHAGAELRALRRDQLLQQPGRPGRLLSSGTGGRRLPGRAAHRHSPASKTVAVTRTFTPPWRAAACR